MEVEVLLTKVTSESLGVILGENERINQWDIHDALINDTITLSIESFVLDSGPSSSSSSAGRNEKLSVLSSHGDLDVGVS